MPNHSVKIVHGGLNGALSGNVAARLVIAINPVGGDEIGGGLAFDLVQHHSGVVVGEKLVIWRSIAMLG